jgi:hypothetical protein
MKLLMQTRENWTAVNFTELILSAWERPQLSGLLIELATCSLKLHLCAFVASQSHAIGRRRKATHGPMPGLILSLKIVQKYQCAVVDRGPAAET